MVSTGVLEALCRLATEGLELILKTWESPASGSVTEYCLVNSSPSWILTANRSFGDRTGASLMFKTLMTKVWEDRGLLGLELSLATTVKVLGPTLALVGVQLIRPKLVMKPLGRGLPFSLDPRLNCSRNVNESPSSSIARILASKNCPWVA